MDGFSGPVWDGCSVGFVMEVAVIVDGDLVTGLDSVCSFCEVGVPVAVVGRLDKEVGYVDSEEEGGGSDCVGAEGF